MPLPHLLVNIIKKKEELLPRHMGFLLIGIGSISDTGLKGAILQIRSHGCAALFFLAGTSYDRLRLLYLDEMGGMAGYPNAKNIHPFYYLIDGFSCIAGHERFCCRIDSFFWNNY